MPVAALVLLVALASAATLEERLLVKHAELARASWLVHGGGGYSRLAKLLVQRRGRVQLRQWVVTAGRGGWC